MTAQLYTARHVASAAVHYTATLGLLATTALVAPVWAIGAAAVLVGGLSYIGIKSQKKVFEENLLQHPDVSVVSPNLGKIAKELYAASGLTATDFPIYDFRIDEKKIADKPEGVRKALREQFNSMADVHNAAAMNLGKPIIMISKPLLALLNDAEEKAVLAHEFAHAAAKHQHLSLPQKLLGAGITLANGLTRFAAFLSAGWVGVPVAIATGIGTTLAAARWGGKWDLLKKPDQQLSMPERLEKTKAGQKIKVVGAIGTTVAVSLFNPLYPFFYVATKAVSAATKVVAGTFSRSNEYQADRGAVELGASPLALITALRKMKTVQEESLKEAFGTLPKSGFLSTAWKNATSTHPTIPRRAERLADIARKKGFTDAQIDAAVNGNVAVGPEHRMAPALIEKMLAR
ncbi:MAG: M48 family metalloprotease [Alphaproteobacteria bacterium]|nr:M48 family metalloprotease [Alphaproteobacteria bacterium]